MRRDRRRRADGPLSLVQVFRREGFALELEAYPLYLQGSPRGRIVMYWQADTPADAETLEPRAHGCDATLVPLILARSPGA